MNCRTCRYWVHEKRDLAKPDDQGNCYFNPPTVFLIAVPNIAGQQQPAGLPVYPQTTANAFCSHHVEITPRLQ